MKQISGTLNVFFPFELKDDTAIRHIRRVYDEKRNAEIKKIRFQNHPYTDMMDKDNLCRGRENGRVSIPYVAFPFCGINYS